LFSVVPKCILHRHSTVKSFGTTKNNVGFWLKYDCFPIGDPGAEDFCFCGHNPRDNSPYCEYHARLAYQPVQERNRQRRFG
jgi:hypothetical protein